VTPGANRPAIRVGIGYDSHRLVPGRQLILGGQRIPSERGLEGHSDADAIAHALTDAILGAAASGDIGKLFPDGDPQWKDADSIGLLRTACEMVRGRGYRPVQADVTVIVESIRIAPHAAGMISALSAATGISQDALSIKGKTNEGMGFIGRGEGVAVIAVATVEAF
jgi:2-C-methyl-D-erythritol 2,4-cyclodiphosphate synthase